MSPRRPGVNFIIGETSGRHRGIISAQLKFLRHREDAGVDFNIGKASHDRREDIGRPPAGHRTAIGKKLV